jgi:ABC-type sugar transport system permease subunit
VLSVMIGDAVNNYNLSGLGPGHNQEEQIMNQRVTLTRQALKTPRAAAVAGIIFAVLLTISIVLMRLAIPEELSGTNTAA